MRERRENVSKAPSFELGRARFDRSARRARFRSMNAPQDHIRNFKASVPRGFAELLLELFPPGSPHAALTAFFDNRATFQAIYDWRRGKAKPPQWALDRIAGYHLERAAAAQACEPSPGKAAGFKNLQRWKAKA